MREKRKMEHIHLALESQALASHSAFDDIQLVHFSLPEINLAHASIRSEVGGIQWESPIMINAMTGGAHSTYAINRDLAIISRETGVSMAVGSQKSALVDSSYIKTYKVVREMNPQGIVIANLSANSSVDEALQAIEMIDANYLQLHLNAPQELVMPEGDRDFVGILQKIHHIIQAAPIPIIIKEVGFGMCKETFECLQQIGALLIDVGGTGGANFVWIENQRRERQDYHYLTEWGQPTAISLLESMEFQKDLQFISSGGIRHPLDMLKSFALGARAVGIASLILKLLVEEGIDYTIDTINSWHEQLRTMLTMLGCTSIQELSKHPLTVTGHTKDWCDLRDVDIKALAQKKK